MVSAAGSRDLILDFWTPFIYPKLLEGPYTYKLFKSQRIVHVRGYAHCQNDPHIPPCSALRFTGAEISWVSEHWVSVCGCFFAKRYIKTETAYIERHIWHTKVASSEG